MYSSKTSRTDLQKRVRLSASPFPSRSTIRPTGSSRQTTHLRVSALCMMPLRMPSQNLFAYDPANASLKEGCRRKALNLSFVPEVGLIHCPSGNLHGPSGCVTGSSFSLNSCSDSINKQQIETIAKPGMHSLTLSDFVILPSGRQFSMWDRARSGFVSALSSASMHEKNRSSIRRLKTPIAVCHESSSPS